jgi:hydrogenase maturation protease
MESVAVIGIGNILRQDDGMGVHVVRQLEQEDLPSTTQVVDGGTSTLNLLGYFLDYPRIIIVDCLRGGFEPGTIYKLKPQDLTHHKEEHLSIHDVQILDVVKMANLMGAFPDVIIFGIEPEALAFDLEMSILMRKKIPEVIQYIKKELNLE